ncbi:hypothetical protein LINGRAHAP2_LOCUS13920 [Linum grandiflorum]
MQIEGGIKLRVLIIMGCRLRVKVLWRQRRLISLVSCI